MNIWNNAVDQDCVNHESPPWAWLPVRKEFSAYVVFFGVYGDVTREALQRDVSRQKLYREAAQTVALLDGTAQRADVERLEEKVQRLEQRVAELEKGLTQAVVFDDDLVDRFAAEAQAEGVSLPTVQGWLQLLLPNRALSVAKLGRSTQATAARVSALLPVLDEFAREQVKQVSADEIYVKAPVSAISFGDIGHTYRFQTGKFDQIQEVVGPAILRTS